MADNNTSGERERLETSVQDENTNEHLHRYAIAMQFAKGKKVLDIASGEGYGSALIATLAAEVTGVDIDASAINKAIRKYKKDNLRYLPGSTDNIPCESGYFDLVVSFETLEHHDGHDEMMQEIKRVLKPGGLLFISSPDKLYYSDKPNYSNPFHVKELYRDEFEALLNKYFKNTFFFGQRSFFGSVIVPFAQTPNDEVNVFRGDYYAITKSGLDAMYLLCLASGGPLPVLNTSILDGANVLKKQFDEFRELVTKAAVDDTTKHIKASRTYKIGNLAIKPFRFFKKLFHA